MKLSESLVSKFAKITNDSKTSTDGTTVFGTVVKSNDGLSVKIDGSNQLTPVAAMADVKNGERVMVLIKDHNATIMGNVSSPSARIEDVEEIRTNALIIGKNLSELQLGTTNYLSNSRTMIGYDIYIEEPLTNAAGEELTNQNGEVLTAGVLETEEASDEHNDS